MASDLRRTRVVSRVRLRWPRVNAVLWVIVALTVAHGGADGVATASSTAPSAAPPVSQPHEDLPGSDAPVSPADGTWGIQPSGTAGTATRPAFVYELEPGAFVDDSVRITNHSDLPLTLDVQAHDAFNTGSGGFDVLASNTDSVDVGNWVTLDVDTVVVPAQDFVDVAFRLVVPSNASPGDHAGGIVASMAVETTQADGTSVLVDHRVGTRIYVRVSGPLRPSLVVTSFSTDFDPQGVLGIGGALAATYTVRNAGNVRLTADQALTVSGAFGLGERSTLLEPMPELLPGGEYSTTVRVDDLRPYVRLTSALVLSPHDADTTTAPNATTASGADSDDPTTIEATAATWVIPWRFLALVAALVGWFLWRRRRRQRPTADDRSDDTPKELTRPPVPDPPAPVDPAVNRRRRIVTPRRDRAGSLGSPWTLAAALASAMFVTAGAGLVDQPVSAQEIVAPVAQAAPADSTPAVTTAPQTVRVEPTSVAIGDAVTVQLQGWPSGPTQFEVCGNIARRGTADCGRYSASAAAVSADGSATATVIIAAPPTACPCVVRVSQAHTAASAAVPIEIAGMPEAAVASRNADSTPVPQRHLEVTDASIVRDEGLGALFGTDTGRRVIVTVRNTGTVALSDIAVSAQLRGGINSSAIIDSPAAFDLEPGASREVEMAIDLPTPAFGDYRVVGRVDGGDEPVDFSIGTSHMPWGLVNAVVLTVAASAVWAARRRRASNPDVVHHPTSVAEAQPVTLP